MRNIIVAVDGSDEALRAVDLAADIASRFGARLTVVHVVEPLFVPPEPYGFNSGALEASNREYGAKVLKDAAARIEGRGIETRTELLTGAPPEAIVDACRDADMLVVGSRGRGAVKRVLLGSVSDRLVHLAKMPVLVVH